MIISAIIHLRASFCTKIMHKLSTLVHYWPSLFSSHSSQTCLRHSINNLVVCCKTYNLISTADDATIAFEHAVYSFEESTRNHSVCVVVTGELGREATVMISFQSHTAIGNCILWSGTFTFTTKFSTL